jgi:hypothetical protein
MNNILPFVSPTSTPNDILGWANRNPPAWGNEVLLQWDRVLLDAGKPFATSHYWSDRHSVNVFAVVGTANPEHIGMTWADLLLQGKRMHENRTLLQAHPEYYHSVDVKVPVMRLVSMDGKRWLVDGAGDHRVCLARYHFERLRALGIASQTMLHGVMVDDYRINWGMQQLFCDIQQLLLKQAGHFRVEPYIRLAQRTGSPGWRLDTFEPRISLVRKNRLFRILGREEALTYRERLRRKSSTFLGGWR